MANGRVQEPLERTIESQSGVRDAGSPVMSWRRREKSDYSTQEALVLKGEY
jgi:hypothetical protein